MGVLTIRGWVGLVHVSEESGEPPTGNAWWMLKDVWHTSMACRQWP